MRFLLLKDLIHPLKNLPSRFRGPHPTFVPFLFNFKMDELEPPKSLLLMLFSLLCSPARFARVQIHLGTWASDP